MFLFRLIDPFIHNLNSFIFNQETIIVPKREKKINYNKVNSLYKKSLVGPIVTKLKALVFEKCLKKIFKNSEKNPKLQSSTKKTHFLKKNNNLKS